MILIQCEACGQYALALYYHHGRYVCCSCACTVGPPATTMSLMIYSNDRIPAPSCSHRFSTVIGSLSRSGGQELHACTGGRS